MTAKEQPTSDTGAGQSATAGDATSHLLERLATVSRQLSALAKALIGFSVSIGVLITLVYFLRIRYLPVENMSSLGALGGVVMLVSVSVLLALLAFWGVPAILLMAGRESQVRDRLFGWFDIAAPRREGAPKAHFGRSVVFVLSTIGAAWTLVLGRDLLAWYPDTESWAAWGGGATLGAAAIGMLWYATGGVSALHATFAAERWRALGAAVGRLGAACGYALMGVLPLWAFVSLVVVSDHGQATSPRTVATLAFMGLFAAVWFNLIMLAIAVERRRTLKEMIQVFGGLSAMLLLLGISLLGASPRLHDGVMSAVSVRIDRAHLVLAKEACPVMAKLGVPIATFHDSEGRPVEGCILPDVTVLSRLGDRWRISCDPLVRAVEPPDPAALGLAPEVAARRQPSRGAVMLDAKSVLSWYELDPEAASPRYGLRGLCGQWNAHPSPS